MPKNAKENKKITLDYFAAMCMKEFTRVHGTLTVIREDVASLESRVMSIESMMVGMATKTDLSELEGRMDKRFDRLETVVADHTFRIQHLERASRD